MLSETDLSELDSSLLPALERHHLRLLAHSLRCLQQVASEGQSDQAALTAWAQQQPSLVADPAFIPVLVEQLAKAAVQLEAIGKARGIPALQLTMADLVAWGRSVADLRLAGIEGRPANS
ncbi:MAG: hypothetical protein RLZZ611_1034 [Cyanobacteriota bacterium]|jgi:hypothetical protein